ncbi:hypothetical protein G9464_02595 [Halostella sp. JP-L12]|uniref:hypothetical protein n=1 Tax=Halostella TaxID=1843185 RepID=UPI000EF82F55|nr:MULTISPECIES: hypothetical protein [Halostella]NHN46491.1 hypothetical protein [Halostella sp. JP-L12]
MGEKKTPNEGTLPCLVCGDRLNYLNTAHLQTHPPEKPQTVAQYRAWVAEQFDLDPDDPAVASNELLKPQHWRANRKKFEGWREKAKDYSEVRK